MSLHGFLYAQVKNFADVPASVGLNISRALWRDQYFDWVYWSFVNRKTYIDQCYNMISSVK